MRVALLATALLFGALAAPPRVQAQANAEFFSSVTALVAWFNKLNQQFDGAVRSEGRAQTQRAVDRLRKDLYALEADARLLAEAIPDQAPSEPARLRLDQLANELQLTVQRLQAAARDLGAELRLNDAESVEAVVNSGLRKRGMRLQELRSALLPAQGASWNGPLLRSRMLEGVEAVREAQLGVTSFSRKLSASK